MTPEVFKYPNPLSDPKRPPGLDLGDAKPTGEATPDTRSPRSTSSGDAFSTQTPERPSGASGPERVPMQFPRCLPAPLGLSPPGMGHRLLEILPGWGASGPPRVAVAAPMQQRACTAPPEQGPTLLAVFERLKSRDANCVLKVRKL